MQSVHSRRITIATAGTATQLEANIRAVSQCWVSCPKTNTAEIFIGGSDLNTSTKRFEITSGDRVLLVGIDLSTLYGDVATNNDHIDLLFYL